MASSIQHRNVYEVQLGTDLLQKLRRDPGGISLPCKDALVIIRFDEEARANCNEGTTAEATETDPS